MIDMHKAAKSIGGLALLSFFPSEPQAQATLVRIVCEMADTNGQVDWLVNRCLHLWSKWEGPGELRAVFCSKFRPRDGVEAYSQLAGFEDGIPSELDSLPFEERMKLEREQYRRISGRSEPATDFPTTIAGLIDLVASGNRTQEPWRVPEPELSIEEQIAEVKRQQAANRARMNGAHEALVP